MVAEATAGLRAEPYVSRIASFAALDFVFDTATANARCTAPLNAVGGEVATTAVAFNTLPNVTANSGPCGTTTGTVGGKLSSPSAVKVGVEVSDVTAISGVDTESRAVETLVAAWLGSNTKVPRATGGAKQKSRRG